MLKGIAFALSACLIWGLIFVVPQFMEGFNSIEVATGRYLFYGILSLLLFFKIEKRYPLRIWRKALLYSLIFAVGYYPCLVLGLRYATPAICALILGIGPITIALYGNWKERESSFRSLVLPSIFILLGLFCINGPALLENEIPASYFLGIAACFCALLTWSWYVVANARFLKEHSIPSSHWSTLNGVTTLFWTLLFVLGMVALSPENFEREKYFAYTPPLTAFLLGSAVLGILCSWVGIFLWNKATLHLPVSFAGQLTIFETIFGLAFIYILEQRPPPVMEGLGITLFLGAIGYGIRQFSTRLAAF